jgi:hypothetical protein
MFRNKKHQGDENRVRLETESCMRDLQGLKELCAQISERRGLTLELPWTTGKPSQVYILTVVWDKSKDHPIWTLYDEIDGRSTPIWSEPFPANNVELVYDILVMSTGAAMAKATVPENLKAGQSSSGNVGNQSAGGLASKFPPKTPAGAANQGTSATETAEVAASDADAPESAPEPPAAQPVAAQPPPPPAPAPVPPAPIQSPQPTQQLPPGYSYPPGMVYQGQPQFPQNMPNAPYPVMQGYPPMQPSPYMFPAQQMGVQQVPNASPFIFAPQQNPMNYPPNPVQQAANWTDSVQPSMPFDASLLDKSSDIMLGELLTRAELITEPTLEAALKIKDLVQEGKLSIERAPELLKTFFSLGGAIEDYLSSADFLTPTIKKDKGKKETKEIKETKETKETKKSAAQEPIELEDALKLLIKSGVLAEADLKMADQVKKEHGGITSDILQAASKLDKNTFEAAVSCAGFENKGLLKLEQCIIALNYCSRSRVSLDEALEELNWENPRKKTSSSQSSS